MTNTIVIVAASLALVGAGVVALLFGVVRTLFGSIGAGVAALMRPIKNLFSRGEDKQAEKQERKERKTKPGVEEVGAPVAAAAAA